MSDLPAAERCCDRNHDPQVRVVFAQRAVRAGMSSAAGLTPDGGAVHLATLFLLGFPTLASFAELGFVCGKYRSAADVAAAGDVMGPRCRRRVAQAKFAGISHALGRIGLTLH
jgi:hypothetical protein